MVTARGGGDTEAGIAAARNQPGTPVLGWKRVRRTQDLRGREGTQAESQRSPDSRAGGWEGLALARGPSHSFQASPKPPGSSPFCSLGRSSRRKTQPS